MTKPTPPENPDPFAWLPETTVGAAWMLFSLVASLLCVGFTLGVPVGLLLAKLGGHHG